MKKFKLFALVFAIMISATGLGLLFGATQPSTAQAKVEADTVTLDAGIYKVDAEGKKIKTKSWKEIATNDSGKLKVSLSSTDGTYLVCGKIPDGVTSLESTFYSTSLTNILFTADFDTSNITSMYWMFYQSKSLVSLDLSGFNTKKVTNMTQMFGGCKKLEALNISSFEISSGTSVGHLFDDTEFGYCEVLNEIVSPKTIASDVTIGLPESLSRVVIFKDGSGNIYDKMPQGQITLMASPAPYFKFITTALDKDNTVYEITAIENEYPKMFDLYKNDKYLVRPAGSGLASIKYIGTGTNIIIPSKIIFAIDAGLINNGKATGVIGMMMEVNFSVSGTSISNFFDENADKITSLTFGTADVNSNVSCSGLVTIVNQLKSLQTLDLTKCDIQESSDSVSKDDINEFLGVIGMTTENGLTDFYATKTSADRKQFLLTWMRNNMIGEGKDFNSEADFEEQVLNNADSMNMITQYCIVPKTILKYSIKTIKMPANSTSTPEITLNGDYTYGDGQKTNKFIYGGEILSYVEGTGSAVDGPSTPSTPSTGVVLDVVLPVASITFVLASLCAVAFASKKKKQL
jgi:surface protein